MTKTKNPPKSYPHLVGNIRKDMPSWLHGLSKIV